VSLNNLLFIDDDNSVLESYETIFEGDSKSLISSKINDLFGETKNTSSKIDQKKKYNLFLADQGLSGIEIIKERLELDDPIKVVFIDMRMPPGIDGKETAKRIRRIDPNIEIVIVTAYSDHDLDEIVNNVGAPDKLLYLKKPFDPVEIEQLALNLCSKWDIARVKIDFLKNISHELNTPLASILGFGQLLAERPNLDENQRLFLDAICENSRLMKSLVDDLITLVKINKNEFHYIHAEFDLSRAIGETIEMFNQINKTKKDLQILVDLPGDCHFFGDKNKLKQCLMNILSNSYKFTKKGAIGVGLSCFDDYYLLKIEDTGNGIEERKLNLIFEAFERVEKDHHNIPGLGIGLTICKKIINDHHGEINITSELAKGTTIDIKLPRKQVIEHEQKRVG
jgi:signal transduction histidine kinase